YDPKVSAEQVYQDLDYLGTRTPGENRRLVTVADDPYEAAARAHAIAVLTEWDEFRTYDWERIKDNMMKPAFLFDGRKLLAANRLADLGFAYYAIGE
ncbi:UDP binding domain-containing protein, partial [Parapedobacter sp. GCM10030251]|uniref:UDP binding domain-containing protein n=1 Tax=Parapedobacter sp. GCM10030251 TaxID=3273419 RepID=UPI00360AD0B5